MIDEGIKMEHSPNFERFFSDDLALHPGVDWMHKGDDMRAGKIPVALQKEFLDTVVQEYQEMDTPDIHPSERIEYIATRLYTLESVPETVMSRQDVQKIEHNLICSMAKEIVNWQKEVKYDIRTNLLASCISHKKYKGIPMDERKGSFVEGVLQSFGAFNCPDEPMTNYDVEAVDLRRFVERRDTGYFSEGINEEHAFLPVQANGYIKAIEQIGDFLDPRAPMSIFNNLVFTGGFRVPRGADLPITRALSNVLLNYVVQKTSPDFLQDVLFYENDLKSYRQVDPRLHVYPKIQYCIFGAHLRKTNNQWPGGWNNFGERSRE